MGKKRKSGEPSESDKADFVPAVFARSIEEAEDFRALLDDHDIPAIVATEEDLVEKDMLKSPRRAAISRGVAVMVPEVLLDEASEVIADREDDEEFHVGDEFEEEEDEDETADLGIDGELDDEEMNAPIPGLAVDDDDDDEDDDDDMDDVPDFLDDSDDELEDDETDF